MDTADFRKRGTEMIDYVADYLENVHKYPPLPNVEPGYIKQLIPEEAPQDPDKWEDVFNDIDRVIMPGMTHWQSPHFHAYFPAGSSYPAMLADILSNGFNCIGFSWASSPACTELEMMVMKWLENALQLPKEFHYGSKGGGSIQNTVCGSTLLALMAARSSVLHRLTSTEGDFQLGQVLNKLVVYTSDQAHSSVERACLLSGVKCNPVESDDKCCLRGDALARAIAEDRAKELIPFYVVATLGTTSSVAFDKLTEIGPVCQREGLWLHVDAAYAGSSFICPEFRHLLNGVEYADTFCFNPHKWMLVNFECCVLWFKDVAYVEEPFNVNPVYLRHEHQGEVPDYRHWQIPAGKKFRSLKLWFVLRLYGIKGLQEHIRNHVRLAHEFEEYVKNDDRFEIANEVVMGLVCFKLKGKSNMVNDALLKRINEDGRIHIVATMIKGMYVLRFVVCSPHAKSSDIKYAWEVIKEVTTMLLQEVTAD